MVLIFVPVKLLFPFDRRLRRSHGRVSHINFKFKSSWMDVPTKRVWLEKQQFPIVIDGVCCKTCSKFNSMRLPINKLIMRLIYLTNETAWDVIKCQTNKRTNEQTSVRSFSQKHINTNTWYVSNRMWCRSVQRKKRNGTDKGFEIRN